MSAKTQHHNTVLPSYHKRRQITGLMFAIPAVVFLCVFVFYPVIYNIWLSFTNAKRLSSDNLEFVALKNYIKLFTDKNFGKRFKTELIWTVASVVGQIIVGLGFALVISSKHLKKGGTLIRTFLLVPYVVPAIVIALVTRWMLSGDYGIISVWLQNAGLLPHRQTLLALPKAALAVVIIINIWRSYPFPMLIYWAALKGIDGSMYEAAKVDGASSWQMFWSITLPQLADTTVILLVLRTVWTATYYDLIQMITGGGPAGSTTHLPIMIYQNSFGNPNIAYASAISVFLGALMFIFVVIYTKKSGAVED